MTFKGIEVTGTIYDNEDETARSTATEAASTARTASQTATTASETATQASTTATTASQTATEADVKATENATAISELQSDVETLDSATVKKTDVTSSVTEGSTAPVTSGGVYNALASKVNVVGGSGSSLSDAFDAAGLPKLSTDIYGICNYIVTNLIKSSAIANESVTLHSHDTTGYAFAIILQKLSVNYGSALIFTYGKSEIYVLRFTGGNNYNIQQFR